MSRLLLEKDVSERAELLVFIPSVIGVAHLYTEFGGEMERGDMGDAHYDHGMATYQLALDNLDSFFALAQGPQAATRGAAVRALCVFINDKDRILPFLNGIEDSSEQVRASVV